MLPPNRLTATYTGPAELPGTRGPGQGCWLFATALAGKPGFISIPAEPTVLTSQRGIDSQPGRVLPGASGTLVTAEKVRFRRRLEERRPEQRDAWGPWFREGEDA